jgi:peptidoglycan glycosyltransferase
MASSPSYDPGPLNAVDPASVKSADSAWADLTADGDRPLLYRATSGLYPPGSTFKVITAAAAIDAGLIDPDTVFEDTGSLEVDGRIIPEFNRPDETRTRWTVTEGLAYSLNVVYAQIGLQLGSDRMRQYGERFGIGAAVPFHLGTASSQLARDPGELDQPNALADTAFGQGALLVTPLHMALVIAGIANGGEMMRPLLVESVRRDGQEIWSPRQERWKQPVHPDTADVVRSMLYESVRFGYAAGAAIQGLNVGAKTGTAESGQEAPHGWFIAFAGSENPEIAVSVCLDYGGEGGGLPLQIGRELLLGASSR